MWASGLAVMGTLAGALSGAWLQRRAAVLQVREQESASERARVREERRQAVSQVLDCCDEAGERLGELWELRKQEVGEGAPGRWERSEARAQAERGTDLALRAMRRAAWTCELCGPDRLGQEARVLHERMTERVLTLLHEEADLGGLRVLLAAQQQRFDTARHRFMEQARHVLQMRVEQAANTQAWRRGSASPADGGDGGTGG